MQQDLEVSHDEPSIKIFPFTPNSVRGYNLPLTGLLGLACGPDFQEFHDTRSCITENLYTMSEMAITPTARPYGGTSSTGHIRLPYQ